jgi:hypothetical protein
MDTGATGPPDRLVPEIQPRAEPFDAAGHPVVERWIRFTGELLPDR